MEGKSRLKQFYFRMRTESLDQKREEMLASFPWYHLLILDFKIVQKQQQKNIAYIHFGQVEEVLEFFEKTSPG